MMPKALVFRLRMKAISNPRIKKKSVFNRAAVTWFTQKLKLK
jgi:hypothetical protein